MNILVGGIGQETNTFSKQSVYYLDFEKYTGDELLSYLLPQNVLKKAGYSFIPAVYARITPSGSLSKGEYLKFVDEFFSSFDEHENIDAIYLCLHGAMSVTDIGSGEEYLLQQLRKKFCSNILIFASFDFHGNMKEEITSCLNYCTAYRTAPHVDELETRQRAITNLFNCLEKRITPRVSMIRIPIVLAGEKVITADYPTCEFISKLNDLIDGENVLDASMFCGFAWADNDYIGMSITVSYLDNLPADSLLEIANDIWKARGEFNYSVEAYEPNHAVVMAMSYAKNRDDTKRPVFISDSGDNITAGASGDNAHLLKHLLNNKTTGTLLCGIVDSKAIELCEKKNLGDTVSFKLGAEFDSSSEVVDISGTLLVFANTITKEKEDIRFALININDVHVLITDIRYPFIEEDSLNPVKIHYNDYNIVVVKLGYLYPDLEKLASHSILAITPGNSYLDVEKIDYCVSTCNFFPKKNTLAFNAFIEERVSF